MTMKERIIYWSLAIIICATTAAIEECHDAEAATRTSVMADLVMMTRDGAHAKWSEAVKLQALDGVARTLSRRLLIRRIDTFITAAGQEHYQFTSVTQCVGTLHSVYRKVGNFRGWRTVEDAANINNVETPTPGFVSYFYLQNDTLLGVHGIPLRADTFIVDFYAYAAALSDSTTEWDLPNAFEFSATKLAAAVLFRALGFPWADAKAAALEAEARASLAEIKSPVSMKRQEGDLSP
jgi:hypothetical protein